MKLTVAVVAALGVASVGLTGSAPAAAKPLSAASGCHRAASPRAYGAPGALQAVQFVSRTTGWVAGGNRVLATTDGGAHWSLQRSARRADYDEVDAIDADHVWIVGRRQLIETSDGGAIWHRLPEPCPVISSVHFVSPSRGFAVSGGRLLRTTDGGLRWHRMRAPATVQSVCFTNSHEGWLGANGRVYRTINAGRVWALAVAGPRPHSSRSSNQPLAEVQCAGATGGWAELIGPGAASNQQPHIGYHLSDKGSRAIFAELYFGRRGVHVKREAPGPYFAAFSSVDETAAVFVDTCAPCGHGTSPLAIATDSGRHLSPRGRVGGLDFAVGAAFTSTSDGWVVGDVMHYTKGTATWKIVHTSDGGHHWTTQYVE